MGLILAVAAAPVEDSWQLQPQEEEPPHAQREQLPVLLEARKGVMPREGFSS